MESGPFSVRPIDATLGSVPLPQTLATAGHRDLDLRVVAGSWPAELTGELVISAPGPRGAFRYALFSPGHVVRLSLRPGRFGAPPDRFAWRARRIESPSVRLHDAKPDVFRAVGPGMLSPFGMMNMSNTAPLPWNGRLFTTWDVGRPIEIDPIHLTFLGEVGSKASWGPCMPIAGVLPFILSTAHPVIDPDRDVMWTVKLVPTAGGVQPHVVRYRGSGTAVETWPVEEAVLDGTMHTVSQTRDWLILIDSGNFKTDPGELAGGPRTRIMDLESPVFLVRKDDVERTPPGAPVPMRRFSIAPPTGHYYARYDDRDGIRVLFEHMDGVDLGFFLKPDDVDVFGQPIDPAQVGLYNMGMCPSSLSEMEFDVETGRVAQRERIRGEQTWNNQLSAMDWSPEGLAAPTLHHMIFSGYRPFNVSRRALDAYRERIDAGRLPREETPCALLSVERGACRVRARWEWPSCEDWAGSPIFVPRGAGRDPRRGELTGDAPGGHDGWVVVPVLRDDGLRVDCFDAARVGDGPIASLGAPNGEAVGFLLHACWLPEARPAPQIERLRFADDLTAREIAALPSDGLRAVAVRVATDLEAARG
jgi:hypothetical protein